MPTTSRLPSRAKKTYTLPLGLQTGDFLYLIKRLRDMTDRDKTDHWDLLASELGAESPAEDLSHEPVSAVEQSQTTPETTVSEPPAPEPPAPEPSPPEASLPEPSPPEPVAKPRRSAAGWDQLASELGVAPKDASEERVAEAVKQPAELVEERTETIGESAKAPEEPGEKRPARRRRRRRRKTREPDKNRIGRCRPSPV